MYFDALQLVVEYIEVHFYCIKLRSEKYAYFRCRFKLLKLLHMIENEAKAIITFLIAVITLLMVHYRPQSILDSGHFY